MSERGSDIKGGGGGSERQSRDKLGSFPIVVRKFEEIRQSIDLLNSLKELRDSRKDSDFLRKEEKAESINGNKQAHFNPTVAAGMSDTPAFDLPRRQTQDFFDLNIPVTDESIKKLTSKSTVVKREIDGRDEHKIPLPVLEVRLETSYHEGISTEKASVRLLEEGENKLSERKSIPAWLILLRELTSGFAILLWCGTILCFIAYALTPEDLSNLYLAIVIILVILLTTGITFKQNAQSASLMNSFKNFLPSNCTVVRDNSITQIQSKNLVRGDIILMKAGEKIPADVRIIESNEMKVDNSPLTGESEALLRTVECSHPQNILEASNIAFFGTLCKEGSGKGVVFATGDKTTLGQIAELSFKEVQTSTPLRKELNRFVWMITIISVVLGVGFFLLALFVMKYTVLISIVFGIGVLVANVPEGLLGCITISLAITAKKLAKQQVLVKNLEAVETLGSTSCICSDKTGTLTQNVMSVKHFWVSDEIVLAETLSPIKASPTDLDSLAQAALLSSEARFDLSTLRDKELFDAATTPVIGDATETGIIRFFQRQTDIDSFRLLYPVAKNQNGTLGKMPFNSQIKFALTIVEQPSETSFYTAFVKGAPEKIWAFSTYILVQGEALHIDEEFKKKFKEVNLKFGKRGERVLGFARLHLPRDAFPEHTDFTVASLAKFNFKMENFIFCGLISLNDPPKTRVPGAILECRSAGVKVLMVTGDQPPTAAAIAREVNIIPQSVLTNEDFLESHPDIDWFEASSMSSAIIVHGDRIAESFDKATLERREEDYYLRQWVKKPFCVFARTTPSQKLQIVKACQREGYTVAATGDGVNDSPAIKQADIGISMNLSGSDVTKDAADMILLDDDFASIVIGVEEGRKIFDNLKKTIVYLLTSNITEVFPFFALIVFSLPLPLSPIYMLIICIGTDIWPALSLAYEEAELDVMTRHPRNKADHLVSIRLILIAYLQLGVIATSAGFLGYFTTFNYFGFPVKTLFGLATAKGFRPPRGDFQTNLNPQTNQPDDTFNTALFNAQPNCVGELSAAAQELQFDVDWFTLSEGEFDLRKSLLVCDTASNRWVAGQEWGQLCDTSVVNSRVISNTACYSTDAVRWAQTSYFVCVVFVQWSNVFACKSRKTSFVTTAFNVVMIYGIIFETILTVFIVYVPGVQNVFGGRPLPFFLFGVPGFIFSILLLSWEEFRKFLVRTKRWFLKYTLW